MNRHDSRALPIALLCGASALGIASMAHAQAAPAAAGNEVVVTGSRTIVNGNNSPTPVTVVSTTQLESVTPTTIPDGLNKLPVFNGSSNATSLGGATTNGTGAFLALRGFGAQRTLILEDGRRAPPTAVNGTVDTNVLPQMLVQRVDVVTGGASAVYGSDAVTGVVNFVLDHRFEGVKMQLSGGISGHRDDGEYKAGIAGGMFLMDGKLHLEGSYERFASDGIGNKADRPVGANVYCTPGAGTQSNPFTLISNCRSAIYSFGGLVRTGPAINQEFATNGVLTPFVHGTLTSTANVESGGDGFYEINSDMVGSLHSDQLFGRADYDLSDSVHAYAQVGFVKALNGNTFNPISLNTIVYSTKDPFLTPAAQAALGASGATTFALSRFFASEPPTMVRSHTQNLDLTLGLDGKLGPNWNWDAYYTMARTNLKEYNIGVINRGREFAASDAVVDPSSGQIVCNVTLTNPGLYPGCIALNPFGPTAELRAMANYIKGTTYYSLDANMDDVGASLTGTPFKTWAGPVRVAASGEYRRLSINNASNAAPTDVLDCTGLRFGNCSTNPASPTLVWVNNVTASVSAEFIAEGALEATVPLLADAPLARSVELNRAVRYTNYTVSGNVTTWKVGLDWHVDDQLSFRGTRSQDIRLPSLFDLYKPLSVGLGGFVDPLTGVNKSVATYSQGNANLVPEVAQTTTVGLVYRPNWLPRFSISVDYYDISMNNAITSVGGGTASVATQCKTSNGTSPLCALYVRPISATDTSPANYPTKLLSEALNVANTKTHGVDSEINYSVLLNDWSKSWGGRLDLRLFTSYQPVLTSQTFAGQPVINNAGTANQPMWKVTGMAAYSIGPWTLNWQTRWRSSEHQSGDPSLYFNMPDVAAVAFSDVTVTYDWKIRGKTVSTYLSVQNVFDQAPPPYASTGQVANPNNANNIVNGDDIVGRYFTIGARARF